MPEPSPTLSVVSFDIDGTLEYGEPPGPVTLAMMLQARQLGHVIGTASDRTRSAQQRLWEKLGVVPDFVCHKHHLERVREEHPSRRLVHIGDSTMDRYYATLAGFEYFDVTLLPEPGAAGWVY